MNLNKNLLGGERGERWMYRKYVHIKRSQAKCVRLRRSGRGRLSDFGDFFAYALCG